MEEETKLAWASKTVTINMLIASGTELFPQLNQYVATHPQTAVLVFCLLNVILRSFTAKGLHYMPKVELK